MHRQHVEIEDLELYVRGCLGPDRIPILEAHLTGCAACTARLEEVVQFVSRVADTKGHGIYIGKVPVDGVAYMQSLKPLSLDRHAVRLLSASQKTLALETLSRVQPGDVVRVMIGETLMLGEVGQCLRAGEKFHARLRVVGNQRKRSANSA